MKNKRVSKGQKGRQEQKGRQAPRVKKDRKDKQEKQRRIPIIPLLILIGGLLIGGYFYSNQTKQATTLKKYFSLINDKKYNELYDLVETEISKEEFEDKIRNIYDGIEANNISINVISNTTINNNETNDETNNEIYVTYKVSMDTVGGKISYSNTTTFVKNGENVKMKWNSSVIHPELDKEDKIRVQKVRCKRGSLIDRNGNAIAKDATAYHNPIRLYPYKEATSIMTGYVQDGEGKSGLEYAFNDILKGEDGIEIYIEKNGKKAKMLVEKEEKDGTDVKLTIDAEKQQQIYDEFKDEESAVVEIDYNTGEVIALVSTPSYDANELSSGLTNEKWEEMQNDTTNPMFNRYLATYAPGSSIKPVIGAIGLRTNSFTAEEDFERSGAKWQLDDSWKNFYVTTHETYNGPANLENALIYSDNIYFAKAGLKIGKEKLEDELNELGFNKKVDFPQAIDNSTYGALDNEKTIANTGYGQGDLLVNPILMSSIYSSFANNGKMVKPYIQYDENKKVEYINENFISSEIAHIIKNALIKVVEEGTATDCIIEGKTIAGKTGTAEIKESKDDENGTENGWFNAFDEDGHLYISMVQNVKGRGGSSYVVKKVRKLFEN